jgi:DNA polymerase III sliding clamp (beta) subunit (PCNA family)
MQLTIHKEKLKDAVSKLRSCLATGSINPILEHFYFQVSENNLTLKATNTSVSMIWETKVDSDGEFSFTLPGGTLSSLVSSLDQDNIIIKYDPNNKDVLLTCGKYEWEASSGDPKDFPNLELPSDLKSISLPQNFQSLLKLVSFSISSDVGKPDLNSLCIDINKDNSGKINLISTDRIRLSCASTPSDIDKHIRFIIPKNSVMELVKLEPSKIMYDDSFKSVYFKSTQSVESLG